jgi:hypothetical protein
MFSDGAISIRGGAGYARFPRQPLAKLVVSLPYMLTQNVPASSLILGEVTDRIVCRLAFDPSSGGERWRLCLICGSRRLAGEHCAQTQGESETDHENSNFREPHPNPSIADRPK